ncbi:MAG: A/G-specific adenine glycosylase [Dehalococcoidia bacterium]|nr:A/G-specific adenine glycosylase [Dehalococcoidia bacterium]
MLQQTQVERVLPYYERWMARWPGVAALAGEALAEVIRAWAGLGYNRRAAYLHRAAVAASERHGGRIPLGVAELRALPGVGPYTAAAVACFAGEAVVPVADTNIARVLARAVVGVAAKHDASAGVVEVAARAVLPDEGARAHNLALMDLGAMACTARAPRCDDCPLRGGCAWRLAGYPEGASAARPSPRFEDTARFARGRIVDALRGAPALTAGELAALLPARHAAELPRYLFALASDGLVEQTDGRWVLAGGQGSSSMASPKL